MERASLTILQGDALEQLRMIPDESMQCCVTSPPYWGLRDYGTASWEGGDESCDHLMMGGYRQDGGRERIDGFNGSSKSNLASKPYLHECGKCGARRVDAQIGLEDTPEEYCAKVVEVFREVRRVLKKDGTLWVNLGDSYWNGGAQKRDGGHDFVDGGKPKLLAAKGSILQSKLAPVEGWKPKDLCGIPWHVAFALRADGWYLRQDIIWSKLNPMPESITDRCTKAHEYLFLLSKNERYYYNAEAIREKNGNEYSWEEYNKKLGNNNFGGSIATRFGIDKHDGGKSHPNGANKRSVWTVPTAPYAEAHFATYPPDLIKPCILAGSRPGDTILDPFAGSGTTGEVALEFGRKAILIELNLAYIPLIERRCQVTLGLGL
jgi:DNA modification methylase